MRLALAPILALLASMLVPPERSVDRGALSRSVRGYVEQHEREILGEFRELLAIPNLASDRDGILRNARAIQALYERRGLRTELLESSSGPPAVLAELPSPRAAKTIVFYAHYDGQPVDPTQWRGSPWTPVLRDGALESGGRDVAWDAAPARIPGEWRIYARSAGDDKAPIVAFAAALDALRAAGTSPAVNLKFFFEGEEEAGSPHLEETLRRHAARLASDGWIFCDGPVHTTRRPMLFFGARGTVDLELTLYGATRVLHSGHYGNWAPNPIAMLADLLAGMRTVDGAISIPGFSDDVRPLTETERRALADVPDDGDALRRELGLARTETSAPLAEAILAPALNFRGIEGGHVGAKASNAIPTEARASIDFRLVPDQTPDRVRQRVEEFVAKKGFFVVRDEPDAATRQAHGRIARMKWGKGYPGERTPMNLPFSRGVIEIVRGAASVPPVLLPSFGGSLPLHVFHDALGAPIIGLPIANHDDNQHAANENLRLQNLWDGIEIYAALFAGLGEEPR